MTPEAILADLVAIHSVCGTPNRAIVEYVQAFLSRQGVASTLIAGPEGDRFNLFATIGPEAPGYLLSAHLDVVPAQEPSWSGDPFRLRRDGERLIGRGAVDMKGFVACMLAAVPSFLARPLARPVHLALSYDEELGCAGVRHLIARLPSLCAAPIGCIVGEPTAMRPVLRHKGKIAMRVTVRGSTGHSSRPDLADNAIHPAARLVAHLDQAAGRLIEAGPFNARFEPAYSTLQVGTIRGGVAVNVVPDLCTFEVEARAIPGVLPADLLEPLRREAELLQYSANAAGRKFRIETEVVSDYPALELTEGHPLAVLVEELSGQPPLAAVSFGTEAGLYQQAGIPALICGPGDIARAHKPDEYILAGELADGLAALQALAGRLAA